MYSDPRKKANILAKQFKSVFTIDNEEAAGNFFFEPSYTPIRGLSISVEGIKKLLDRSELSQGCWTRPSSVSPTASTPRWAGPNIHTPLPENLLGRVTAWCLEDHLDYSNIKEGRQMPANYRPVGLTCGSYRLFEHILASHIRNHLDKYGILYPGQHRFRMSPSF